MVRTARSGKAGQLDAAPPRATPKTVSHSDTVYHISIHKSVTEVEDEPGVPSCTPSVSPELSVIVAVVVAGPVPL